MHDPQKTTCAMNVVPRSGIYDRGFFEGPFRKTDLPKESAAQKETREARLPGYALANAGET
jgi:hypothetical protein